MVVLAKSLVGVGFGFFVLGSLASLYLGLLDFRSCRKHWRNYLVDRGKPLNKNSGAKWQGKWKFGMENVVICAGLISYCPQTPTTQTWAQYILLPFEWLGGWSIWLTLPALLAALLLARSSLRSRGVLKSREQREEEKLIRKHKPPIPADAAVDPEV